MSFDASYEETLHSRHQEINNRRSKLVKSAKIIEQNEFLLQMIPDDKSGAERNEGIRKKGKLKQFSSISSSCSHNPQFQRHLTLKNKYDAMIKRELSQWKQDLHVEL